MSQSVLCDYDCGEVQVSGGLCFRDGRWREALLHYLFGVWSNDWGVMHRPKINFFGLATLRLDKETATYSIYGPSTSETPPPHAPLLPDDESLYVTNSQTEVEQALIRFVKNNRIKSLTIMIPTNAVRIVLWKKRRRGQLGVSTIEAPYLDELPPSEFNKLFW